MQQDSDWVLAVLADLLEFCEENDLPDSHRAIEAALKASTSEVAELRLRIASPDVADNTNGKPKPPQ
jgi:hypothetical protein